MDHFEGQYRQRKKRRLTQTCNDIRLNVNTQLSDINTRVENSVMVVPRISESVSRSV